MADFDVNAFLSNTSTSKPPAPTRSKTIPPALAEHILQIYFDLQDLDDNFWDLLRQARETYQEQSERRTDIASDDVPNRLKDLAERVIAIPGMKQELQYHNWNETR